MKVATIFLFCFWGSSLTAQVHISGYVKDTKGEAVYGANIFIEGTYEGTSSGPDGSFSFTTKLTGEKKLIASFIGYTAFSMILDLNRQDQVLNIVLKEEANRIGDVVITAGAFEASDEKKSVILKPFDIATTPSAQGDVFGALGALPGSQKAGESGKLFVRGGESYETKMFMDGMLVQSPYFSNMPDIPTRGRFSPLLFSEAVFSTGGYSAEYGQALSSIVAVNTNEMEPKDKTSFSLMTVGANVSHVERWDNTSLALSGQYVNAALHNALFNPTVDWIHPPEIADADIIFRQKTGKNGMIKSFGTWFRNASALKYNNIELNRSDDIYLVSNDLYFNTTYKNTFGDKWMINAGYAVSFDQDLTTLTTDRIFTRDLTNDIKLTMTHFTADWMTFRIGGDMTNHIYKQHIDMNGNFILGHDNRILASFAETEMNILPAMAIRLGARLEYNTYIRDLRSVPRISAAYKIGKYGQISTAYGQFSQNPGDDYLKFAPALLPELADHYIVNYQYSHDQRTVRIEGYYKKYTRLVKYSDKYSGSPDNFNNTGYGNARGFDIFWRDQTTFKNSDYWISYSFILSQRNYKDYPTPATPEFISKHNLSLVYKRYFESVHSFFGFNYTFAGGRPYNDPNMEQFMAGKTRSYHDISFNFTYLTAVCKKQAVLHLMMNNLLGTINVFGYHFSSQQDRDGKFTRQPVESVTGRQAVLGLIIML